MLNRLSLRSKLILVLLGVSLLSCFIMMMLGRLAGVESISNEVYERLTSARNAKAFEIEEYFDNQSHAVEVLAANPLTAQALLELTAGFRQIQDSDTISCTTDLNAYYDTYLDSLDNVLEVRRDITAFYPTSAAACYLQYHYVVKGGSAEERFARSDAGDGSDYSNAHRKYHDFFTNAIQKFGFYDVFMVDLQTEDIVYSSAKEADYATNLRSGPYRNSNLAELVQKVRRNADLEEAQVVDFDFYRPSYGAPAAFLGSPIFFQRELIGVLVFQISIEQINYIMNYGQQWRENGLGESGEVLLVGDDYLLRSDSRLYLEDREKFLEKMTFKGMPEDKRKLLNNAGPILVTELRSQNITEAMRGRKDIIEVEGYHGQEVLSAFTPLDLPGGLRWALVTEIDKAEAMAPVNRFERLNLSALAFIIALTTILAMLITRSFIRPIDRLAEGARAVSEGDTSIRVAKSGEDEMGRLTDVFNSMVASIDEQKKEIQLRSEENNALLYSRFPDSIAERYRNGESNIVDSFAGVAVLSCDLRETQCFDGLNDEEAWIIVQDISERFNKAAERMGMEVVHPVPDGYLAVCGMNIPRLDNGRRTALLALEVRQIIASINAKYELSLVLNVGMAHGPVLAGILQDESKQYIIWGPTVDAAQRLAYIGKPGVSMGTRPLMDLLEGNFQFSNIVKVEYLRGIRLEAGQLDGRVADLNEASDDTKAENDNNATS